METAPIMFLFYLTTAMLAVVELMLRILDLVCVRARADRPPRVNDKLK